MAYSSFGVSPKDRCTVPPRGSWVATEAIAVRAAARADADRVVAEHVTVEPVTDLLDRARPP